MFGVGVRAHPPKSHIQHITCSRNIFFKVCKSHKKLRNTCYNVVMTHVNRYKGKLDIILQYYYVRQILCSAVKALLARGGEISCLRRVWSGFFKTMCKSGGRISAPQEWGRVTALPLIPDLRSERTGTDRNTPHLISLL